MKSCQVEPSPTPPEKPSVEFDPADYALRVVVVHEEGTSRLWAEQLCQRVAQLVGAECLRSTGWSVRQLTLPSLFQEAVEAAIAADVILVSVSCGEQMPSELCAWIEAWLPRRPRRAGALLAIFPKPARPRLHGGIRDYLKGAAQQGGLDFLPQERPLPPQSAGTAAEFQPNYPTADALQAVSNAHGEPCFDWGINE
jgi:hypothetical protein